MEFDRPLVIIRFKSTVPALLKLASRSLLSQAILYHQPDSFTGVQKPNLKAFLSHIAVQLSWWELSTCCALFCFCCLNHFCKPQFNLDQYLEHLFTRGLQSPVLSIQSNISIFNSLWDFFSCYRLVSICWTLLFPLNQLRESFWTLSPFVVIIMISFSSSGA